MRSPKYKILLVCAFSFLAACSPQAVELDASATATVAQNPTATEAPTTAITPSPTPPLPITADTIAQLTEFQTFSSQDELIRTLAFSPDGNTLASAGGNTYDFIIRIWDVANQRFLRTLEGHTGIVWMVAFSPDGSLLASASSDHTVRIWDWQTGTQVHVLDFQKEMISVGFSPDGQTLAAGGVRLWPDAAIWTYAVSNWQPVLQLNEFWNIPDIAYTPNGQLLIGGGTSRNVRVWDANDGAEISILNHSGQVSSMDVSLDGFTLATGLCETSNESSQCTVGAVWLWDLANGIVTRKLSDFSNWVNAVAYTPDGSLLIAGARDGTFRAYSTLDFSTVLFFTSPGGEGIFDISADGRLLAIRENEGVINLWRVEP